MTFTIKRITFFCHYLVRVFTSATIEHAYIFNLVLYFTFFIVNN